jgi:hypothetical protein
MILALLLAVQVQTVVEIRDLSPQEHRSTAFVLSAPQELQISAVGAEPWPERYMNRDDDWQNDEQTTWPAAAWILDAKTRAVVWDLRAVETQRSSNGLRRFSGKVRLPAGVYEVHFAFYSSLNFSMDGEFSLRELARLGRQATARGHYAQDDLYKQFGITIEGSGREATNDDLSAARAAFTGPAIATVTGEHNSSARKSFAITRPTAVEIYAIGELRRDGAFDYGWIMNADSREPVWTMTYDNSEPAGGASKNRMVHETLRLKPGRYVAYFASDDSHGPDDWNGVPPVDPEFWGMTLRVNDAAARAAVRPFDYEPVPAGETLVSLIEIGDDANRSAGFTLRRPMDVRVYAIGEASGNDMVDYAWIVDAASHKRIWTMRYDDTEHAGGAEKNRLFDKRMHLDAGSYLVYYKSDGSHSYDDWNASAPAEPKYWGVSVFPASGRLNPADVAPFERPTGGTSVAELVHMGNEENARMTFRLARSTKVRIYALGEGSSDKMFDYGSITDSATGRVIWEMKYDMTEPAGGAGKNRVFDGVITLPAGAYVLRYRSDGSHAYGDWNDDPPDDPESWGISVFRMSSR